MGREESRWESGLKVWLVGIDKERVLEEKIGRKRSCKEESVLEDKVGRKRRCKEGRISEEKEGKMRSYKKEWALE